MHSKGLEFPQYEPRGSFGMAASYAVSDRDACHMRSYTANSEVFEAAVPPYTHEGKGQVMTEEGFQDMLDQYYEIMGRDKNGCLPQDLIDTL